MRKNTMNLSLISLLLVGCQEDIDSAANPVGGHNTEIDQVVNTHGEVENADRLDGFVRNVDQGRKDAVQIVSYTTEGDPIFYTLEFDGATIQFEYDSSKDQFGSGKVSATACNSMIQKERDGFIDYELQGCEREKTFTVLTIEK